jgi:hypothetical protein
MNSIKGLEAAAKVFRLPLHVEDELANAILNEHVGKFIVNLPSGNLT